MIFPNTNILKRNILIHHAKKILQQEIKEIRTTNKTQTIKRL